MAIRTKKETVRERVYLTFPKDLIKEPILSLLAKQFDIVFNIRSSTVTAEMGLVALEIGGKSTEVEKAIGWLKEKGVMVEPIEKKLSSRRKGYCATAEIESTSTPPSCGGPPPKIKFPLFDSVIVVSTSGFSPSCHRILRAMRWFLES
jgi:hypothetical protein